MNSFFPFVDIIILGLLAIFLGFRLKNLLGDRSGFKGETINDSKNLNKSEDKNKVVSIHEKKLEGMGIEILKKADPNFSEKEFIEGAESAFNIIIKSFSESNLEALKPLLDYELHKSFSKVISEREALQEKHEVEIVSIDKIQIIESSVFDNISSITLKIVSQQIKIVRDIKGNIIDGDAENKEVIKDKWIFERDVSSINPNWKLVETDAADD